MVKRLMEKFDLMEIREVTPIARYEVSAKAEARITQPLLAHQSPSPVIVTHVASIPPMPVAASNPGPR